MSKKRCIIPIYETCAVITAFGILFAYHDHLYRFFNRILISLSGKDLFARSSNTQRAADIAIFFILLALLLLIDRLIFRKIKNEKTVCILQLLFLTVPIIQTLIICANQVLRRDDYWEIADAHSYGFPGSILFEITHHNGRYLSWGIKSTYAFLPPIPFINILLFLNICLLTFGFMLIIKPFLTKLKRDKQTPFQVKANSFSVSLCLAAMIIILSSNTWEVWFWGSGTWVYGLTISLCIFSFALIFRIANGSASAQLPIRILAGVTCFLSCGGSELSTISLAAFLFYLLIWKRINEKRWNKYALLYLCEVIFCGLGIIFLSGSLNSAEEFAAANTEQTKSLFTILPNIIKSIIDTLWRYTTINIRILLLFLAAFFLFGAHYCIKGSYRKICIISLLLLLTANFVLFLNMYIEYIPPRVVTIPLCWIFTALALQSFAAGSLVSEKTAAAPSKNLLLLGTILTVLNCSVFYFENIDLIRQIRTSWAIREETLKDSFDQDKEVTTCSLPSLGSSHDDLEKDPAELYNIAMRMYLRVPAVTADKRCPPFDEEP